VLLSVEDVEERWRDDAYTVDSQAVIERAETRAELEDALVRLPFDNRAAVLLHDVSGWKAREVAEAMDIGLPAAKQRLRRGRMMLVARRLPAARSGGLRCGAYRSAAGTLAARSPTTSTTGSNPM
jgi:DNA-directed RNA polymerase specialized sigma24 family protein